MSGGGSSITVESISVDAAKVYGYDAYAAMAAAYTAAQSQQYTWQSALAGIIGTYGYIKQAELLERQTDQQDELVAQGERYLELAERTFEEVTLDAYGLQKNLFLRYRDQFAPKEVDYLDEALRLREYDPDYALQEGRAISSVQANIDRARLKRARQRPRYATGACCYEDTWFAIEGARLTTDAANRGYRFEEDRKFRLDQWYWTRWTAGAQLVENMRAHVISGVNSGVANVSGGLGQIGSAVGQLGNLVQSQGAALRDQASFFGTLANGAFRFSGYSFGMGAGMAGPSGASAWGGMMQQGSAFGYGRSGGSLNMSGQAGSMQLMPGMSSGFGGAFGMNGLRPVDVGGLY